MKRCCPGAAWVSDPGSAVPGSARPAPPGAPGPGRAPRPPAPTRPAPLPRRHQQDRGVRPLLRPVSRRDLPAPALLDQRQRQSQRLQPLPRRHLPRPRQHLPRVPGVLRVPAPGLPGRGDQLLGHQQRRLRLRARPLPRVPGRALHRVQLPAVPALRWAAGPAALLGGAGRALRGLPAGLLRRGRRVPALPHGRPGDVREGVPAGVRRRARLETGVRAAGAHRAALPGRPGHLQEEASPAPRPGQRPPPRHPPGRGCPPAVVPGRCPGGEHPALDPAVPRAGDGGCCRHGDAEPRAMEPRASGLAAGAARRGGTAGGRGGAPRSPQHPAAGQPALRRHRRRAGAALEGVHAGAGAARGGDRAGGAGGGPHPRPAVRDAEALVPADQRHAGTHLRRPGAHGAGRLRRGPAPAPVGGLLTPGTATSAEGRPGPSPAHQAPRPSHTPKYRYLCRVDILCQVYVPSYLCPPAPRARGESAPRHTGCPATRGTSGRRARRKPMG